MRSRFATRAFVPALLIFAGCKESIPNPPDRQPVQPSPAIRVDFYVDASAPMRGFLAEPRAGEINYFLEMLDKGPDGLRQGWKKADVFCWSFGQGQPQKVASSREFHYNPALFKDTATFIDKAVLHDPAPAATTDRLKVIVTDLFQDRNDMGKVVEAIGGKYLSDESTAVAILGIRNAFDGQIDDLPGTLPRGAADSLPFYVLVAGKTADVRVATDRLTTYIPAKKKLTLTFARNYARTDSPKLSLSPVGDRPGFVWGRSPDRNIGLVKALRDVKFQIPAMSGHEEIDSMQFRVAPRIQSSESATAVEVDQTGTLLTVHKDQLEKRKAKLFRIDFVVTKTPGWAPPRIEEWNLESGKLAAVLRARKFDAVGAERPGKTPNVAFFFQLLADRMFQQDVYLAHCYLYAMAR